MASLPVFSTAPLYTSGYPDAEEAHQLLPFNDREYPFLLDADSEDIASTTLNTSMHPSAIPRAVPQFAQRSRFQAASLNEAATKREKRLEEKKRLRRVARASRNSPIRSPTLSIRPDSTTPRPHRCQDCTWAFDRKHDLIRMSLSFHHLLCLIVA